jgi:hypothetical protein
MCASNRRTILEKSNKLNQKALPPTDLTTKQTILAFWSTTTIGSGVVGALQKIKTTINQTNVVVVVVVVVCCLRLMAQLQDCQQELRSAF